jgi:hypothetical protein
MDKLPDTIENVKLSPTEKMVISQIYSRIDKLSSQLPPEILEKWEKFWLSQLPDGDPGN